MRGEILRVLLVVLVVSSSTLAAPAVAQTADDGGQCEYVDGLIAGFTFGHVNNDCWRSAFANTAIEDMKQSDANQTKVDIYSAGAAQQSNQETFFAPYDNYLNDSESVAWMKAQVAVAEAYEDGKSKAEAQIAAREAVADYYAVKQSNLIEKWNTSARNYQYLREQAEMEDNISANFLDVEAEYQGYHENAQWGSELGNTSVQLVNGSSHDTVTARVDYIYNSDTSHNEEELYIHVNYTKHVYSNPSTNSIDVTKLHVKAPNSNYDKLNVTDTHKYKESFREIESKNTALQAEAEAFVNATWDDFDSGAINASDVIGTNTAMFEYGVRSGNESESLWRSTAALAMMGFDTPDLNNSGTMDVTHDGVTRTGVVMAREAPNGTWQANTTYDAATIDGPVFMLTTDGKKVDLEGEFTIDSVRSKDGTSIDGVQTTSYAYKTADTSELLAMQEELTQLRQEVEDREATSGGGGGNGDGMDRQTLIIIVLAAAIGGVVISRR